jgi:hypothetical protein
MSSIFKSIEIHGEYRYLYVHQRPKFYQDITFTHKQCFKGIEDDITNSRRVGDVDEDMTNY